MFRTNRPVTTSCGNHAVIRHLNAGCGCMLQSEKAFTDALHKNWSRTPRESYLDIWSHSKVAATFPPITTKVINHATFDALIKHTTGAEQVQGYTSRAATANQRKMHADRHKSTTSRDCSSGYLPCAGSPHARMRQALQHTSHAPNVFQ